MDLTPEEKRRIYLEEKARLEPQAPAKKVSPLLVILLILISGSMMYLHSMNVAQEDHKALMSAAMDCICERTGQSGIGDCRSWHDMLEDESYQIRYLSDTHAQVDFYVNGSVNITGDVIKDSRGQWTAQPDQVQYAPKL